MFLFWTGRSANEVPIRDVIAFSQQSDDVFGQYKDIHKAAVAEGVAEVLNEIDL